MPLVIAEHTMGDWTDEEVLRHCVKEYANPGNYEPYEKDYGEGRPVMRTPYFARNPRAYAEQTLQFLNQRQASRLDKLAQRPNIAKALEGLHASEPGFRVPDSPALHMQVAGRAYRNQKVVCDAELLTRGFSEHAPTGAGKTVVLNEMQLAYVGMHNLLKQVKESEIFNDLPATLQDEINSAEKAGSKWL